MSLAIEIVPVTAFQQNCSILVCTETKQAVVVDPGGDVQRIVARIQELKVSPQAIWLTHGHIDHAGGAAVLARTLNIPIEGPHQADNFWIQGLPQQAMMFRFPEVESFIPTRWLIEGDSLSVGKLTFQVIHTPGHTPGHVVFFNSENKLALVGDVIFNGSIGRTDFPQSNHADLIHSIREKLFLLGDDVTFIPGHGPTSTISQERRNNPFVADHRG
ncbi:MAG: MBL fold metallo-hydrolase [Venatoribacter sp.]